MRFFSTAIILIFLLVGQSLAYHRKFTPKGSAEEVLSLIYLELRQEKTASWALVPKDLRFKEFLLLPHKEFLLEAYRFDLSYPTKSILYQTFLEYNVRYFLADKTLEYLNYQRDLEKFQEFYKRAQAMLGPYFTQSIGQFKEKDLIESSGPLSQEELEKILAERLISRLSSSVYTGPSYSSGSSGGRLTSLWQKARYETVQKETKTRENVYDTEDKMPGFFQHLLNFFFGAITWFGKNKEVLLILYGFVLLIAFLVSAARK